jgi:integrase
MRPGPRIKVQQIQERVDRAKPFYVRWTVDGVERGPRTFDTKREADDWRSALVVAARDSEKWDMHTGLPVSWNPIVSTSVADFARHYWAERTLALEPRTAAGWAESFSRFVVAAMPARATKIPGTYLELAHWVSGHVVDKKMADWLSRWSGPVSELDQNALARVHKKLLIDVHGEDLGDAAIKRRFTHASALLDYAVEIGALASNDLKKPSKTVLKSRRPQRDTKYPDMAVMRELVTALDSRKVASRLFRAVTAVGVFAGLRPSETFGLEVQDVTLPETGWGEIRVERSRIGLKGWSEDAEEMGSVKVDASWRKVPISPLLVVELRAWLELRNLESGPLFRTTKGKIPVQSSWARALDRATLSLGIRDLTPYDLRRFHGTWLAQSGVPYNEAARRMGHSLETFMRYYVGTTDDVAAVANAALDRALS